jgi:hypothetical protein
LISPLYPIIENHFLDNKVYFHNVIISIFLFLFGTIEFINLIHLSLALIDNYRFPKCLCFFFTTHESHHTIKILDCIFTYIFHTHVDKISFILEVACLHPWCLPIIFKFVISFFLIYRHSVIDRLFFLICLFIFKVKINILLHITKSNRFFLLNPFKAIL